MALPWFKMLLFAAGGAVAAGSVAYYTGALDPYLHGNAPEVASLSDAAAPQSTIKDARLPEPSKDARLPAADGAAVPAAEVPATAPAEASAPAPAAPAAGDGATSTQPATGETAAPAAEQPASTDAATATQPATVEASGQTEASTDTTPPAAGGTEAGSGAAQPATDTATTPAAAAPTTEQPQQSAALEPQPAPGEATAPEPTVAQPAVPEPSASGGQPAAAEGAAGPDKAPSFDLVRVEGDGSMVIAGKAASASHVEIMSGSEKIGDTTAGGSGDFVVVLDKPLEPGDYQIVLRSTEKDGTVATSDETAVVSVPDSPSGQVLAMVEQPGEASRLLTVPEAPAGAGRPAAQAEPAVEPQAEQPAAEASPAQAGAPEAGAATGTQPSGEQAVASAEPQAEPAAPEPQASGPQASVAVEAVEIEGDRIFVAGRADPGRLVRVYANEILLGQSRASEGGRFLVEAQRALAVGDYIIRADALGPDGAKVVARAAVPFEREPGEAIAAVAPPASAPVKAPASGGNSAGTTPAASGSEAPAAGAASGAAAPQQPATEVAAGEAAQPQAAPQGAATDTPQPAAPASQATTPAVAPAETAQPEAAAGSKSQQPAATASADQAPAPAASTGTETQQAAAPAQSGAPATGTQASGEQAADSASAAPAETPAASAQAATETQAAAATTGAAQDTAAAVGAASGGVETVLAPKLQAVDNAVIIRRGDTLWRISKRVYGRGIRYSTIYLANQDQIRSPHKIWPGQIFAMPEKTEQGEAADWDALGDQITPRQRVIAPTP